MVDLGRGTRDRYTAVITRIKEGALHLSYTRTVFVSSDTVYNWFYDL